MSRALRTGGILAVVAPVLSVALLVLVWRWYWAIPLVAGHVQVAIGRTVGIAHPHVSLGRISGISADDVRIANLEGLPVNTPFTTAQHLHVEREIAASIHHSRIIPVPIDRPKAVATEAFDERNLHRLDHDIVLAADGPIGTLNINAEQALVIAPRLASDAVTPCSTIEAPESGPRGAVTRSVVDASGASADQPPDHAYPGAGPVAAVGAHPRVDFTARILSRGNALTTLGTRRGDATGLAAPRAPWALSPTLRFAAAKTPPCVASAVRTP